MQKWHVPADAGNQFSKAFKFQELVFEKAEESKKRKRPLVKGNRESYCATPPYAFETNAKELQDLVENLRLAGKATLFCDFFRLLFPLIFRNNCWNVVHVGLSTSGEML